MAFDNFLRRQSVSIGWLIIAILSAAWAGMEYDAGNYRLCAAGATAAAVAAFMVARGIRNIVMKVRYVMDATLNGDFSYKFPTGKVGRYEGETNMLLNRIVEHLENLTSEIRRKEAFLEQVINLTDIGMVVADAEGNVRLHNEPALRLLQRPALTHICQLSSQVFSELSIRKHEASLNGEGVLIYTISDLRRPIQAAEVESWEKLTRVLTHEIMNSLTPIRSIAENMKDRSSSAETEEAFATISASSRSLMTFVRNFRQFSVLPEVQMHAFYLKPLLENCMRMGETYAPEGGIRFELICFPPDVMVYTDEALLTRVITNILKNATEASPHLVKLETCVLPDETVEIRISNDGELIAEENALQIFTPFFTTRQTGSGIGLSLSRRIITHLGGTLTLKTRPHTCFIIRI